MSYTKEEQKALLDVAYKAIDYKLATQQTLVIIPAQYPAALQAKRATFVTLEIDAQLRGCIGSLEARQPLVSDVAYNAHAAAFSDPRFNPVIREELKKLSIHISVLSEPQPLLCDSEQDLINKLVPGKDGLILEEGSRRATFLPSVWESLPDPRQFIAHLKQKGHFQADYWSPDLRVYRYYTDYF